MRIDNTPEVIPETYTVETFCKSHNISRAFFYALRKQGKGPRVAKLGTRTIITREAASNWRAALDAAAEGVAA